jgi:hypothetical protein
MTGRLECNFYTLLSILSLYIVIDIDRGQWYGE